MFATDNVQIEVDAVVEIGQEIEDIMRDIDIVLPSGITDFEGTDKHVFDDF